MQTPLPPLNRTTAILLAAWQGRAQLTPVKREPLERQFLPAALEIIETPAPALAHALLWTILIIAACILTWAILGRVDMVAIAPGKVIAAGKAKVIQPAETAVVKRILVRDGQTVKAGDILIELEAAATATAAETDRVKDGLNAARLESARHDALAKSATGTQPTAALLPSPRRRGEGVSAAVGCVPVADLARASCLADSRRAA